MTATEDNASPIPPEAYLVPVIGFISDDGRVVITDPHWRLAYAADVQALFPNETREA